MGKIITVKKISKKERELDVLLGLVDLYVKEGKPIGSHTLQEEGFSHLSSATIRNYFAKLETEGYLKQHHTSGGRAPTDKAFRLYAEEKLKKPTLLKEDDVFLASLLLKESKAIPLYLQKATQGIAEISGCSVFLIAPRFDQDFITKIELIRVDYDRILAVILTDFGQVHTEIIPSQKEPSPSFLKKASDYFDSRLTGGEKPTLTKEEESIAKEYYNEIALRHFVNYTSTRSEEIYKCGFSKLLLYPEFHDPTVLSNTLALFENTQLLDQLLATCFHEERTKFWIGDDLVKFISPPHLSSLVATPYQIGGKTVGVLAFLGPDRLEYGKVFAILQKAATYLSENLTKSLYKFKLTYRRPKSKSLEVDLASSNILHLTHENSNE